MHYPNEKWFPIPEDDALPAGILDERLHAFYDPQQAERQRSCRSAIRQRQSRRVCAAVYRQSDQQTVYIPMNIIGNLYVSNGMSAGNTANEARAGPVGSVRALCENRIIAESISLPAIPDEVLNRYPGVVEAIAKLEKEGFPSSPMTPRWAATTRSFAWCCSTRPTAPASLRSARTRTSAWRWSA